MEAGISVDDRYGNRNFVTGTGHTTTLGSCSTAVCNPSFDTNTTSNRFASGQGYSYDADGNVTQDSPGQRFQYDSENHQKAFFISSNSGSTPDATYSYDGEGKRVKKVSSSETTIFVYDATGKVIAEYSTALATTQQVSYLTQDHLGSQRIITNENGVVIETGRTIFHMVKRSLHLNGQNGLSYTSAEQPRKDFTGYEKDSESGLEFANARYLNSTHGRFTSVDPLMASANPTDPQTFNRYSYVMNKPMTSVDPTGLKACFEAECSGVDDEGLGLMPEGARRSYARYDSIQDTGYDPETNRFVNTVTITNRGETTVLTSPTLDDVTALVDLMNANNTHLSQYMQTEARSTVANGARILTGLDEFITKVKRQGEGFRFDVIKGKEDDLIQFLSTFYSGSLYGYHSKDLGCSNKGSECIDYRSETDSMSISGSMQIVINKTNGGTFGYFDVDRFNPYQDVRGALGHLFIEVLGKEGYQPRPEILNRASNIRDSYNRGR